MLCFLQNIQREWHCIVYNGADVPLRNYSLSHSVAGCVVLDFRCRAVSDTIGWRTRWPVTISHRRLTSASHESRRRSV